MAEIDYDWNYLPEVDGPLGEIQSHLPKPALVKATIFSVLSLAGVIFGREFEIPNLDLALDAYTLAVPAVFGFWVNRKVNVEPASAGGKHRA